MLLAEADRVAAGLAGQRPTGPPVLLLDASPVGDLDATGVDMLHDILTETESRGVEFHLADVKGPVRDVLRRAGTWERLGRRVHASTDDAVRDLCCAGVGPADHRGTGIDERPSPVEGQRERAGTA
jgi:SulP family sulfate permease